MSIEELIKNLREIANTNSISMRKRDVCAEAADVIGELSKQVATWHDASSDPPPEYVSVIGHRTWFCQTLHEECEVTQWTEIPKYKGRDNENG